MTLLVRILLIALASVGLAFAACGDDDDDAGNGSGSPVVTGSPSATDGDASPGESPGDTGGPSATATPRATEAAPTPNAPGLDAGVEKIGEGTITFVLVPGGQFPVDGLGLVQTGTETPPCAAFVFAFKWQVTDPFPPGENSVTWRQTQQDSTLDVGSGADGTATVGCGQLMASNGGPDEITVNVRYVLGATQA